MYESNRARTARIQKEDKYIKRKLAKRKKKQLVKRELQRQELNKKMIRKAAISQAQRELNKKNKLMKKQLLVPKIKNKVNVNVSVINKIIKDEIKQIEKQIGHKLPPEEKKEIKQELQKDIKHELVQENKLEQEEGIKPMSLHEFEKRFKDYIPKYIPPAPTDKVERELKQFMDDEAREIKEQGKLLKKAERNKLERDRLAEIERIATEEAELAILEEKNRRDKEIFEELYNADLNSYTQADLDLINAQIEQDELNLEKAKSEYDNYGYIDDDDVATRIANMRSDHRARYEMSRLYEELRKGSEDYVDPYKYAEPPINKDLASRIEDLSDEYSLRHELRQVGEEVEPFGHRHQRAYPDEAEEGYYRPEDIDLSNLEDKINLLNLQDEIEQFGRDVDREDEINKELIARNEQSGRDIDDLIKEAEEGLAIGSGRRRKVRKSRKSRGGALHYDPGYFL